MSIRRRMTLSLVLALVVLLGGASFALYEFVEGQLTRQFDEALMARAQGLHSVLRRIESGRVEFDFSDDAMPEFNRSRAPEYFELRSVDGTPVERSESLGTADLSVTFPQPKATSCVNLLLPDGRRGRAIGLWISPLAAEGHEHDEEGGSPRPPEAAADRCFLVVARDRIALDRTLSTLASSSIAVDLTLACLLGALVPWLINRNFRPISEIAAKASQIDSRSLHTRFPVQGIPEELSPICTRLNDSMERLQVAFERERRFSAAVAHELRTPIAELRLLTEVALRFPDGDPAHLKAFTDAHEVAGQMEVILVTLLEMIESDSIPAGRSLERVDLVQTVETAWRSLQEEASAREVSLHRTGLGVADVAASPTIVRRVFDNLLENALEYSPAGACVECQIGEESGVVVVQISNPTMGLAKEDLAHITEPFWRKDSSRTGGTHSGLGLSLVGSYVRRLRANMSFTLNGGVFEVTLQFSAEPGAQ